MIINELSETADIDFLLACREGDVNAFAALYAKHAPAVLRYAWSRIGDRSLAEEILQDTFTTAWAKRRSASIVDLSLLPWLLAICHNYVRNQVRRSERTRTIPLESRTSDPATSDSSLALIKDAMDALSQTDRRIVELCLIEGFSYRNVAEQIDSTPAAVGKRLQRARSRLQAALSTSESEMRD
jgi:RNA polymerase sigma-70 factor (ECF subfamily)